MAAFLNHLGKGRAHLVRDRGGQFVDEGILLTQPAAVAGGPAQESAQHIPRPLVGGDGAVGYGECKGPHMVGDDLHGHGGFAAVFPPRQLGDAVDDG